MSEVPPKPHLTHFDAQGQAHMVDVADKAATRRMAKAGGMIEMQADTWMLIQAGNAKKGDVLGVARLAGIMAAKRTGDLIPLCHPIALTHVAIDFEVTQVDSDSTEEQKPSGSVVKLRCRTVAETVGPTGVEMEALTACSVALLTVYDMCKAVDRSMVLKDIALLEKTGGKSGRFIHPGV